MSTCKDCLHYEVCECEDCLIRVPEWVDKVEDYCGCFKPKADYVEVKYGEWISELVERCDWRGRKQKYYQPNSCNLCHKAVLERTNFCPNCGAKMNRKEDENA